MYSGGHTCSLANCTSAVFGKKHIETKFHRFPKDHARCAVWNENCKPNNLPTIDPDVLNRNHRLCSLHFEDKMYLNNEKNRLSNQAIPTLFNCNIIRTEDQSSQHDQHVNISSIYLDDNTQIESSITEFCCSIIIDNPPRCSTPISSVSFSSCTSVDTCSISIQTPNSLTAKTLRKRVLQQRLSKALCTIKELEKKTRADYNC